ncbi:MAG: 5'/3'-nucleotidase SurE [Methylococcales bacterium]|jgi:5'-nucleotidase|nr:5'/3'-nucleotidase SurE [Methylococcales bacterium]MBT3816278.1 5'/3'-nucleotidase SurE [Methylococcales bacterium]MBT4031355.1 5'/3'-nucleotidase SurE [Methylococcales bacterium]MBT4600081.1 5'/3'-nucleotidase SurE [Methylococcales bacterium]MBT7107761.1 5'/3'-nucleotidase SurE [Methylococcales bacterium]
MKILLSNDDGYFAKGLLVLAAALKERADITIVAPDKNRSAASNSLTLELPLRAFEIEPNFYKVDGTPTDCVHLAITGLVETEPDMVIAGINHGANMGDDVLYSGTLAAATEGRFLGFPAIAISLASNEPEYFETAAEVAVYLLRRIQEKPLAQDVVLNVNVPDIPVAELKGYQVTRLGQRHKSEPVIKSQDPRGRPIYWVGPPGLARDDGFGTDFDAVRNNYVSITPLQLDLTRYELMNDLSEWIDGTVTT